MSEELERIADANAMWEEAKAANAKLRAERDELRALLREFVDDKRPISSVEFMAMRGHAPMVRQWIVEFHAKARALLQKSEER